MSVGRGELDFNGFWEFPCYVCAREAEKKHPEWGNVWPYSKEYYSKEYLDNH